ncbi:MAG TPA: exopolysaccharide biosynthesis protein [Bauldia sp.]|nr:exopolysaccharide biosynthesis protein [Bauldia sp.]
MTGSGTSSSQRGSARQLHASQILESLAAGDDERIPFSTIVAAAGSRVHGLALLVFVLPEVPPLPLPSASTILGIPLIIVSAHLALFGESALVPARIQKATIPRRALAAAARYLAPVFRWIERASRPRWLWLARRHRLIGVICLYLSVILILPIPLLNTPPAVCVAAVALGMIQRDGVFITVGIAGGLVVTAMLVGVFEVAGGLLLR